MAYARFGAAADIGSARTQLHEFAMRRGACRVFAGYDHVSDADVGVADVALGSRAGHSIRSGWGNTRLCEDNHAFLGRIVMKVLVP
jgi:hypothetical protein